MTTRTPPGPARIRDYLTANGWRVDSSWGPDGAMFVFEELSDDGQPITVFVPGSSDEFMYPLRVSDVVDTLAGIEERPKDAVWADLCATETVANTPTPAPTTPAPNPADPVSS